MFMDRDIIPGTYRRITAITECRTEIQELHAVWQRMRGARELPARRDFDPVEVPWLLSRMFLVDVLPTDVAARRYRVRLEGTELVASHGRDWTGRFLHEVNELAAADRLVAAADYVVARRAPLMSAGQLYWLADKRYYHYESIVLPLAVDDRVVNMLMGITIVF